LDELKEALGSQFKALFTQMRLGISDESTSPLLNGEAVAQPDNSGGEDQTSFDALDINQDGIVSAEELMTALQQQFNPAGKGENSTGLSRGITDSLLELVSSAYSAISRIPTSGQTLSLKA
jgi:hypothetical protein